MVWVDTNYSLLQQFCLFLLKFGPIPRHVAIIMDGNRRYAKTKHLQTKEGHVHGSSKLREVLRWCKDIGVKELTVYAFSVENFKRTPEEVSFLLNMAADRLQELLDKIDELDRQGICVRLIGNLSMLPARIQRLASELMCKTRFNKESILNVCMAYGSQEELTEAVERVRLAVRDKLILPDGFVSYPAIKRGWCFCNRNFDDIMLEGIECLCRLRDHKCLTLITYFCSDITPELLSHCLYTRLSRPLDLFIRTSGEVRLSDFLTWQGARGGAVHQFVRSYWPAFSLWNFMKTILHYQLTVIRLGRPDSPEIHELLEPNQSTDRTQRFLDHVDRTYWAELAKRTCSDLPTAPDVRLSHRSVGNSSPFV